MYDLVGLSEYIVVGVAVVLLGAALLLARQQARSVADDELTSARAATADQPVRPEAASRPASPAKRTGESGSQHRAPVRPDWKILAGGVALAVLAVGLAASLWDTPGDLATFGLLLGVGGGFAVLARLGLRWRERDATDGAGFDGGIANAASWGGLARPGLLLLGGALVLEAGALGLFWIGRGLSYAWLLHVAAVVLAGLGFWRAVEPAERRLVRGWRRIDTACLIAVVVAALAVRVWRLGVVPEGLWFDESQRGLEALRMLAERGYRPIFAAGVLQEPTGVWYLLMPLIALLGRDPVALRLPVALVGAIGVGAIYLLAWVLYGRRVALVAGGLAIALTWHLNFSRIALPAVISLTCDTLAAALFLAGLKRGSRMLLGLAGLACGAGLYFYFTSQLMPPVLALAGAHHLLAHRFRWPRRIVAGLLACALAFLLTVGPFAFFALTRPEQFLARADAVNVMRDVQNARSWEPVWANVRAHLLMFQVRGDNNGRHNWTGRPMLDPVTGGLAILGLGLALTWAWRLENSILLGWIPLALAGGILSSIWDAPQAHRAIDALVPAVILAALPVGLLWQAGDRQVGHEEAPPPGRCAPRSGRGVGLSRLLPATLVIAMLLVTGASNLYRFFRYQQTDEKTWTEMMAPQTAAGRQVAGQPADTTVYLEPNWAGHPSVRFLDPIQRDYVPFDPGASVPVTADSAAIMIGERAGAASRIARIYPGAARTVTVLPRTDRAFGYGFVLSPDTIRSTRGVLARYEGSGGVVERREASLSFDVPTGAPMATPFAGTWTSNLSVPTFAAYRLRLDGPASLTLTLDGIDVVRGGAEATVRLARGLHALRLTGSELGGQPIRLLWAAPNEELRPIPANLLNVHPVETEGLLGRVFRGREPTGDPVVEQIDPSVELRVHLLPSPRPYTLEWSGSLRVDRDGHYRFGLSSLGPSTLWLDGAEIVRKGVDAGQVDGEVELRRGWHEVRIRFVDVTDFSYVTASWQPPGAAREPIPPTVLRPWPPDRVRSARPEDAD